MSKTILIAGGSGLIGSRLAGLLRERGYSVRLLTRTPNTAHEFRWNPSKGEIDDLALQNVNFVVNLAGAGIADKRWTAARKRLIIESRVLAARVLADAFSRLGIRPEAYISTSAIGYYGNSREQVMTETDAPVDQSFMVTCCRQWEAAAADAMPALGIRTVILRTGVVLAREGGALAEILKPLRWGLGVYFGDGRAWWSWIHLDDICRMFLWSIENTEASGVYNAVAPHPVRGKELLRTTAAAMRQPAIFLPAPGIALRLVFGEMSAVILNSNHISSRKIESEGFQFLYPEAGGALRAIFSKKSF